MENIFEKLKRLSEEDLAEISEVDSSELDEFDEDDIFDPRGPEFEKVMIEFFNEINADLNLSESFRNNNKLAQHYEAHCIAGDLDKKSSRQNVYYDFNNVSDYAKREDYLFDLVFRGQGIKILSLQDVDYVLNAFRKFFEGGFMLMFSPMCGLTDAQGNSIMVVLNSFANDVTKNYLYNTLDYMIIKKNATATMFPIDVNYLQNKFNNIVQRNFPELVFPINGPHRSNKYL